MKIFSLEAEEIKKIISEQKGTVIIYFWQDSCGPCEMLRRSLDALPDASETQICSIRALDAGELTEKYFILSLPALLFFKDGELRKKTVGYKSTESLQEILKAL